MEQLQIGLGNQILLRLREIQSLIKIDGDTVSLSEIINLCLEAGMNVISADLRQNEAEESL